MARNEQLIRQLRILQVLDAARYGLTLAELRDALKDQLGISQLSERTVRRDLAALQCAGIDVESHAREGRIAWSLGPRMKQSPQVTASVMELLSLSLARDLLGPLMGTAYWQGIETLWNKLEQAIPEPVDRHFRRIRQGVFVRTTGRRSYAAKQGVLATLNRAILLHRVCELQYTRAGDEAARLRAVEPLALVLYNRSFYLVARLEGVAPSEGLRHFKVDRIGKATCTDRHFRPPDDFDAEKHLAHSLGMFQGDRALAVTIRFGARVATWAQEQSWHDDQEWERLPSGDWVLTLPAAYEDEILPRVLALGPDAEILAPATTRLRARQTIEAMRERYGE